MRSHNIEVWVGIFVTLGLAAFLMLALKVSHLGSLFTEAGYSVSARFQNIGSLKVKAPVKMAGVRVGRVSAIDFDDQLYQAVVTMDIEQQYDKIPIDTSAAILTAGLLGEQYIGLEAGAEEAYLTDNSEIMSGLTQSAVILEQMIGQFLYQTAAKGPTQQ